MVGPQPSIHPNEPCEQSKSEAKLKDLRSELGESGSSQPNEPSEEASLIRIRAWRERQFPAKQTQQNYIEFCQQNKILGSNLFRIPKNLVHWERARNERLADDQGSNPCGRIFYQKVYKHPLPYV